MTAANPTQTAKNPSTTPSDPDRDPSAEVIRSSYALIVGTKVGPIIAAIIIDHMRKRLIYCEGIIIGPVAIKNMTHHAQSTMPKNASQKSERKLKTMTLYEPSAAEICARPCLIARVFAIQA